MHRCTKSAAFIRQVHEALLRWLKDEHQDKRDQPLPDTWTKWCVYIYIYIKKSPRISEAHGSPTHGPNGISIYIYTPFGPCVFVFANVLWRKSSRVAGCQTGCLSVLSVCIESEGMQACVREWRAVYQAFSY